jgi:hypothetical protein
MHLQFVESESTFAYFHATRAYLEAWGKPVAFYSDKHGVFRVNQTGAIGGDGMTQFGRALHALNIDIICANSSQAKGRVERAHKTLQDRLVKELRLAGARTLARSSAYNQRSGREPPRLGHKISEIASLVAWSLTAPPPGPGDNARRLRRGLSEYFK